MFRNYLKIAWRTLGKQRGLTFINVFGLALGLTCCLLITLYVVDELSYDRYNTQADRIYRLHSDIKFGGNEMQMAVTPDPLGPTLKQDYPQVEQFVRLHERGTWPVKRAGSTSNLREDNIMFADSTLFAVFTLPLLSGDPKRALTQANSVVISESAARRHFGGQNPMGQTLIVYNKQAYKVTGVMRDMPANAHFHADFFLSMLNDDYQWGQWLSNNHHTYILLKPGVNADTFAKNFDVVVNKYVGPQAFAALGSTMEQFRKAGNRFRLWMIPLETNY
jgi:putative ABC transport system permease protein